MTGKEIPAAHSSRLPESAFAPEPAIDPGSCIVFPGFALGQHRLFIGKGTKEMRVIRHDDEVEQSITIAIKMVQAPGNDDRQFMAA